MAEITKKEYKYHFIYKTTNILTGRFYIGMHSTNKINDGYLGGGDIVNFSIKKYGRKNHKREILEFLDSRNSLDRREREIVNEELLMNPLCMNLVEGGNGGFSLSPTHCKKLSDAGHEAFRKKLKEDPEFKRAFGDRVKEHNKIKKELGLFKKTSGTTGMKHSEEAKSRIGLANSESQQGRRNSQYGRFWVFKGDEVKRISESELSEFLSNGWKRGKNESPSRKWIYKGSERKRVSSNELEKYLIDGWTSKSN